MGNNQSHSTDPSSMSISNIPKYYASVRGDSVEGSFSRSPSRSSMMPESPKRKSARFPPVEYDNTPVESLLSQKPLDEQLGFHNSPRGDRPPMKDTDVSLRKSGMSPVKNQADAFLSKNIIIDYSRTYGEGAYGTIYKAKNTFTQKIYAVKIIRKKDFNQQQLDGISRETAIAAELVHPNIIRTYFVVEDDDEVKIYMDFAAGGDLLDYMVNFNHLNECRAYILFHQMVEAVAYLHNEMYIVHRDIKLENMIIDNKVNLHLYLIDFGFSFRRLPGDPLVSNFSGTPNYAAPEIYLGKKNLGFPADIWALGVCLYGLVVGGYPFGNDSQTDVKTSILNLDYDLRPVPSKDLKELISDMFDPNEKTRLTIQQVQQHPWMKRWEKYLKEHKNCDAVPDIKQRKEIRYAKSF